MNHNVLVKSLCQAFQRRVTERGDYGKGIGRDKAAMEFFIGAANSVALLQDQESPLFKGLTTWIVLILAPRGYKAILDETMPILTSEGK